MRLFLLLTFLFCACSKPDTPAPVAQIPPVNDSVIITANFKYTNPSDVIKWYVYVNSTPQPQSFTGYTQQKSMVWRVCLGTDTNNKLRTGCCEFNSYYLWADSVQVNLQFKCNPSQGWGNLSEYYPVEMSSYLLDFTWY